MDTKLIQLAESRNWKIHSLEDPKTQLAGFQALTKDEQLAFLKTTLDDLEAEDENDEDGLGQLIDIYLRGNSEALKTFFLDEFADGSLPKPLTDKIVSAVLTQRNEVMAASIKSALKQAPDQVHVFAAGTAHFVIGPSVIDLLAKDGFRIKRVEE